MWIYQEHVDTKSPAVRLPAVDPRLLSETLPENKAAAAMPAVDIPQNSPSVFPKARKMQFTDCWLLAGAFLLGCTMSGALLALSAARQMEWLRYYLQAWLGLFGSTASKLFMCEYLTLSGTATILLMFGFSAFGPVLTFFFFMIYGTGSGLLTAQLLAGTGWSEKLLPILFSYMPACAAAGLLCILGGAALRVSGKIRAYSFQQGRAELHHPDIRVLTNQYVLTLVLLLPLCGAAAGLSCLGNRLL